MIIQGNCKIYEKKICIKRILLTFRTLRHLEAFPVVRIRQFLATIGTMPLLLMVKYRMLWGVAMFQWNSEIISTIDNLGNYERDLI